MQGQYTLHHKFSEEYQKLNPQQQKAVDTIEGPVMVIAGPGTGKTQILSARIAKILLETDALPSNILCLTYTDAGVLAMRRRLLNFIGTDAYKVNIYTYHAFCNDIIQDNLSLFEKNALDPVSDLEKIEIFKELIDAFPKGHPLKRYRGDVYFEINNLQQLFSNMKKEGWTPAFLNSCIDKYLAELPTRDEFIYKRAYKQFKAGDLKKEKIEEETERMQKLRAAVNEFDHFQQLMRNKNRYDFDDMINWVIKAFKENKNLLAAYQEKFLYILVDEYQDTSGTQNNLVDLLISYWDVPNIFVVGDDDQSIYRFQGANVENMKSFADTYSNALVTIILTNNYRSTQSILDISKHLIDNNQERLINKIPGLSKTLTASNTARLHTGVHPQLHSYISPHEEMMDIVLHVKKLIEEGVAPGSIGIIYKENKYGDDLLQYSRQYHIPVYTKRSINLLQLPFISSLILMLRYLATEHDIPYSGDEMLFEILHARWWKIPPVEIAKLTMEAAQKKYNDPHSSLRNILFTKSNEPPKDLFSKQLHDNLKNASKVIEDLIGDVSNETIQTLLEHIIRNAGILGFIQQNENKIELLQALTSFFNFVKDETRRHPFMKLQQLTDVFDLMEKEELAIPMTQVSGSESGVNLMTAHSSKGLEFKYVFFAGCNAGVWEKKRKPGRGYKLPDNIFSTLSVADNDLEELRRLFYVALTRAEENLYISYSRFNKDGKETEPSVFIAEIMAAQNMEPVAIQIDKDIAADFALLQFQKSQAPEIEKIEEEYVKQVLEKFAMNVTALNNYLKCPLEFYFKNLVRIPSPKNEATEFGSAVHYALEQLFKKMSEHAQKQFPAKQVFIKDFEWYMIRHRESFTKKQYDRRMEQGNDILSDYYDTYLHQWSKIVSVERNIRNVVMQGIPLKGKLDKLEFDGNAVNVVDYKTGDFEKAKKDRKQFDQPNEKMPNGGDYWRQGVFYKILVDNYENKQWHVLSTEFDFVEPDKKKKYYKEKLVITNADITTVQEQIKKVWQKIQQRDFYKGCGKEDCHWCNFVKTNNLAIAMHDIKDEEEEN